ncbi:MAG: MbnP family protein, partial [Endozoicomonas sp.]
SMHWHWQAGYKFFRVSVVKSVVKNDHRRFFHLGSLACHGSFGSVTGCDLPNRGAVVLDDFSPGKSVYVDVSAIIPEVLLDSLEAPVGCMGQGAPWCEQAVSALGLDPDTGLSSTGQQVFSVGEGW